MFRILKRAIADRMSHRDLAFVRSHTRDLNRLANAVETAGSRVTALDEGAATKTKEWQAMTLSEGQLACSISAAVSGKISVQAIVSDVIRPILHDAVVVSVAAHDAITRVIGVAETA